MPIGWFIVPYKRSTKPNMPIMRYPEIDDYTPDIEAAGGKWSETEVLGNRCIVKVRASTGVLNAIAAVDGFQRLPKNRLDDPLSDLSTAAQTKIKNALLDMGYPLSEIKEKFGNNVDLTLYTLRDVLKFATRRRLKPRYNEPTDEIICDGIVQPVKALEIVDLEVTE